MLDKVHTWIVQVPHKTKGDPMKNLLISIALVVTLGLTATAAAEPLQKSVTQVTIKNMKTGRQMAFASFEAPKTLLRKACPGERDRDCLYIVEGKKEHRLWQKEDFKIDPDWDMVVYAYEAKIEVASR